MSDFYATIRLRPTRVALLVRPADKISIRKFMRICCCMWGGRFNPIIPVFRNTPSEWRDDLLRQLSGKQIAHGYVDFFEPDAFVEAEAGLLERCGLKAVRDAISFRSRVVTLDKLLVPQPNRDYSELALGLSNVDALRQIYHDERKFVLRDAHEAVSVNPDRSTALVEAMFGAYPSDDASKYFGRAYEDVFKPKTVEANPGTWRQIFRQRAATPLSTTTHKIQMDRSWQHDPVIYVFDPKSTLDLIDLWNIRLEPAPVVPIPVIWWNDLVEDLSEIIRSGHRPLQGNPHGIMHSTTIEFSRSITEADAKTLVDALDDDLPDRSWSMKLWRTPVWKKRSPNQGPAVERLRIQSGERRTSLPMKEGSEAVVEYKTLNPDFAHVGSGGHQMRWINQVEMSHSLEETYAISFPFNAKDPSWPRLDFGGERVVVGQEGWAFAQDYVDTTEWIQLHRNEDAVIGFLEKIGIEAKLSEPGHIARQV